MVRGGLSESGKLERFEIPGRFANKFILLEQEESWSNLNMLFSVFMLVCLNSGTK